MKTFEAVDTANLDDIKAIINVDIDPKIQSFISCISIILIKL